MARALTSLARTADTSPLSMRGHINYRPKSNCQQARSRWALPFQMMETNFTSQQVAGMPSRLSTRRRMKCRGRLSARGEGEGEESIVATIPVGNRAWGIALDPSGSKLYTANGASNDVSVVDVKSRKELRRIKAGDGPWGIAIVSAAK